MSSNVPINQFSDGVLVLCYNSLDAIIYYKTMMCMSLS